MQRGRVKETHVDDREMRVSDEISRDRRCKFVLGVWVGKMIPMILDSDQSRNCKAEDSKSGPDLNLACSGTADLDAEHICRSSFRYCLVMVVRVGPDDIGGREVPEKWQLQQAAGCLYKTASVQLPQIKHQSLTTERS